MITDQDLVQNGLYRVTELIVFWKYKINPQITQTQIIT